jgi:hypothetical protein
MHTAMNAISRKRVKGLSGPMGFWDICPLSVGP